MYHDYNRIKKKIKDIFTLLACIVILCVCGWYLISFAVFCISGQYKECDKNTEAVSSESASIIHEQTSKTNLSTANSPTPKPTIKPTPSLSPTPALESAPVTPKPIPSTDGIQTECTENVEPAETPVVVERKNKLYYFMENGVRTDVPIEYQDYLYDLLEEYGHADKYELMLALIYHESNWQANVVSRTHDYGLMQINRCNHNWLKETLDITDFLDPYQSMQCGVHMLCGFFDKYSDAEYALVCYNMGEGRARRSGVTSTRYSRGVLADMDLLVELEC